LVEVRHRDEQKKVPSHLAADALFFQGPACF